jgi:uncharacterized membrane protein
VVGVSPLLFAITLVAALGSAVVGGIFYGFSAITMPGLERLPEAQGVAAMQQINVAAPRPPLMLVMGGTAVASLVLLAWAVATWSEPHAKWLAAGAVLYLAGAIVVTGRQNVPLNDALEAVDPASATAAAEWAHYLDKWTLWNHIRGAASVAAGAAFVVALTA